MLVGIDQVDVERPLRELAAERLHGVARVEDEARLEARAPEEQPDRPRRECGRVEDERQVRPPIEPDAGTNGPGGARRGEGHPLERIVLRPEVQRAAGADERVHAPKQAQRIRDHLDDVPECHEVERARLEVLRVERPLPRVHAKLLARAAHGFG